jgi:hypothetical protein
VAVLYVKARQVEVDCFLENSVRYHRKIRKAFSNLKCYAVVNRNARNSQEYFRLKQLKIVFDGFYRWMSRGDKALTKKDEFDTLSDMSQAERLVMELRVMRLNKLRVRKDIIAAMKAQGTDSEDLDERGNKIISKPKEKPKENTSENSPSK